MSKSTEECAHLEKSYTDGMYPTAEAPYDEGDFWWSVDCKNCGEELAHGDCWNMPQWVKELTRMSKSTEELREQSQSYSPEIKQLAYAMESMSHVERCAALYDLAEKQHAIGMKNGRFGYISKHDFDQELSRRVEETRLEELETLNDQSEAKEVESELYPGTYMTVFDLPINLLWNRIAELKRSIATLNNQTKGSIFGMDVKVDPKVPQSGVRFDHPDGRSEGFTLNSQTKEPE